MLGRVVRVVGLALVLGGVGCDDSDKSPPTPPPPACDVHDVLRYRAEARAARDDCKRGDSERCKKEREQLELACNCGNEMSCDVLNGRPPPKRRPRPGTSASAAPSAAPSVSATATPALSASAK
jgi:hypothetical protein